MATATRTRKNQPKAAETAAKAQARLEELAALKKTLDEKVTTLRNSEQWEAMLRTMAHFHHYSFQNMLLIWAQKPDATYCTGYQSWKKLGYQVRKGEKGLRIFAPRTFTRLDSDRNPKLDEEGKEIKGISFHPASTFDRSQVDATATAQPLDDQTVTILEGNDEHGIILSLSDALKAAGWTIKFKPISGGANGFTNPKEKRIVIDNENPIAQQAKTLIHESAHALLHTDVKEYVLHRGLAETEAESTAFVVAAALGWNTGAYSVGYVTGWSNGEPETLEAAGKNVLKAAHTILEWIDSNPR